MNKPPSDSFISHSSISWRRKKNAKTHRLSILTCAIATLTVTGLFSEPASAALVGVNTAATASDRLDDRFGSPHVNDGESAYWLAPNESTGEYVTVNLGAKYNIDQDGITLTNTINGSNNDSGTENYTLLLSEDGVNFSQVASGTLAQNTTPVTPTVASQKAQFVRFRADSFFDKRAGLQELEINGSLDSAGVADRGRDASLPINGTPGKGVNIALNKPVTASDSFNSPFGGPAAVTDGGTGRDESWALDDSTSGWAQVDLGAVHNLAGVELVNTRNDGSGDSFTYDFRLQLSTDGTTFTTVLDDVLPQRRDDGWQFLLDGQAAQYVRFQADGVISGKRAGLAEMRVFEVIPEPATAALVGVGGLLMLRRPKGSNHPLNVRLS